MESLPDPSETVDDEWAAMKIRFNKEGLVWDKLEQEERLLQVCSAANISFERFLYVFFIEFKKFNLYSFPKL